MDRQMLRKEQGESPCFKVILVWNSQVSGQIGKSAGWFLATLSQQVFTTISDPQVFIGKQNIETQLKTTFGGNGGASARGMRNHVQEILTSGCGPAKVVSISVDSGAATKPTEKQQITACQTRCAHQHNDCSVFNELFCDWVQVIPTSRNQYLVL